MSWKQSIDDIKVICKNDNTQMILESSLNRTNGIFICPKCKEHINLNGILVCPKCKECINLKVK